MNIFIAGLSYRINDADLKELFSEYGDLASSKVIMDKQTGRSKGYGFVEIEDEATARKAIEELNIYYVAATRAKKAIKMADLELQYNSNELI